MTARSAVHPCNAAARPPSTAPSDPVAAEKVKSSTKNIKKNKNERTRMINRNKERKKMTSRETKRQEKMRVGISSGGNAASTVTIRE